MTPLEEKKLRGCDGFCRCLQCNYEEALELIGDTQSRILVILELVGLSPPFGTQEEQLVSRVARDADSAIAQFSEMRERERGVGGAHASAVGQATTKIVQ